MVISHSYVSLPEGNHVEKYHPLVMTNIAMEKITIFNR